MSVDSSISFYVVVSYSKRKKETIQYRKRLYKQLARPIYWGRGRQRLAQKYKVHTRDEANSEDVFFIFNTSTSMKLEWRLKFEAKSEKKENYTFVCIWAEWWIHSMVRFSFTINIFSFRFRFRFVVFRHVVEFLFPSFWAVSTCETIYLTIKFRRRHFGCINFKLN